MRGPPKSAERPGWTRKGFLHTRWRLGGASPIDLVNVHLFHDESNLHALAPPSGGGTRSLYADNRNGALGHVLQGVADDRAAAAAALGSAPAAAFVFGDFNFRLDQRGLLLELCGADALATAEASQSDSSGTHTLPLVASTPPAPSAPSAARQIVVGKKKFEFSWSGAGAELVSTFRRHDREADVAYVGGGPIPMREIAIGFPPTYNRPVGADSEGGAEEYATKRCPAWTDRGARRMLRRPTSLSPLPPTRAPHPHSPTPSPLTHPSSDGRWRVGAHPPIGNVLGSVRVARPDATVRHRPRYGVSCLPLWLGRALALLVWRRKELQAGHAWEYPRCTADACRVFYGITGEVWPTGIGSSHPGECGRESSE